MAAHTIITATTSALMVTMTGSTQRHKIGRSMAQGYPRLDGPSYRRSIYRSFCGVVDHTDVPDGLRHYAG